MNLGGRDEFHEPLSPRRDHSARQSSAIPKSPPFPDATLAPDPESACAGKGIWGAFGSGVLHRWDQQDEAWKAVDLPDQAEISDLTCREDGTLFATSKSGELFARQDGTWEVVADTGQSRLLAASSRGNTVYAAGDEGAMFEFSDAGLERRGGGLLPDSLRPTNFGFSELWVNTEGTEAIFMGGAGVYRLTAEGARDVTPPQEPPNTEFGDALRNEIWGLEDPEFAITESRVLRWTAAGWEVSSLTSGRDGHFRPVDIAGTEMCVARSTGDGWRVFEPLFEFVRFAPLDLLPWTFVDHPDYERPLIASNAGVLIPTDDRELRRLLSMSVVDAEYVADPGVFVAATTAGSALIARWNE